MHNLLVVHWFCYCRLFPPDLFESFITIGHYQWDIAAYSNLVDTINTLPVSCRHTALVTPTFS